MKSLKKFLRKSLAFLLVALLATVVFPVAILGMFYEIVHDSFFKGGRTFADGLCELIDNLLYTD